MPQAFVVLSAGFSRGHGTRKCGETHASSRNWFSSRFCGQRSLQCRQNPPKNRSCSGCEVSTTPYEPTNQCSVDNGLQNRVISFFSIQVYCITFIVTVQPANSRSRSLSRPCLTTLPNTEKRDENTYV